VNESTLFEPFCLKIGLGLASSLGAAAKHNTTQRRHMAQDKRASMPLKQNLTESYTKIN